MCATWSPKPNRLRRPTGLSAHHPRIRRRTFRSRRCRYNRARICANCSLSHAAIRTPDFNWPGHMRLSEIYRQKQKHIDANHIRQSWRVAAMGIRDRPTLARSPSQNGYAERLIGSIRRECLDHVVVVGERHLHHVLASYQKYYNEVRTRLSVHKDVPVRRDVRRTGRVRSLPILGGLHHRYVRV
jgi:hypothetical protein